jgi:23S rRNA (cytosine1962-C5)-methyltransferase
MNFILENIKNYKLLDSGLGEKLEVFGDFVVRRPDPEILWTKNRPEIWDNFDLYFKKEGKGFKWFFKNGKEIKNWEIEILDLKLLLKLNNFKHTGLFPEQILQWQFLGDLIEKKKELDSNRQIKVLNLFGYSGGASVYLAKKGALVTHVDSSRQAISWAKENENLNNKNTKLNIRYILEDAFKFVENEIKRGASYDAILMDPPTYGKSPKGKKWILEENIKELLFSCKKLLSKEPIFFVLSGYSAGYSHNTYRNLLLDVFKEDMKIESGELCIKEESSQRFLSSGIFARIVF